MSALPPKADARNRDVRFSPDCVRSALESGRNWVIELMSASDPKRKSAIRAGLARQAPPDGFCDVVQS